MNAIYRQKKATIDEAHAPGKYASKTVVTMEDEDDILSHHTKGLSKMTLVGINTKSEADFPTLGGGPAKPTPANTAQKGQAPSPWAKPPAASAPPPSSSSPSPSGAPWGGTIQPPSFPATTRPPQVVPPTFSVNNRSSAAPPPQQQQPVQPPFYPSNPVSQVPAPVYQYQPQPAAPSGSFAPHIPMRQVFESLLKRCSFGVWFHCLCIFSPSQQP